MTTISMRKIASFVLSIVLSGTGFVFSSSVVFAQASSTVETTDTVVTDRSIDSTGMPAGTVSCFDYYAFGSIQADITSTMSSVVNGTSLEFSGSLKNENAYPIVDGALYVKIFRSRGDEKDVNGPDVVDQYLVKGDIAIPAHTSVPVSFSWVVPSYAVSGEYKAATFFTVARKFNLLGLSFTDDVVGNTVPFTVVSEENTGVSFDKAKANVDGKPYFSTAYPKVAATGDIPVGSVVYNSTNKEQRATVAWTVYQWDAQLRENVLQAKTETVTIPAHSSAPLSISVTDTSYPVYLVVGTLSWEDTHSIMSVRFVREGVDRLRLNFPSVTTYPLKAGQELSLFSCLHNSGTADVVKNGKLVLTLSDEKGNIIHDYTYSGDVTGAMMGVADKFVPQKDYTNFTLDARLYQNDKPIDEVHLVYACGSFAPDACGSATDQLPDLSFGDFILEYTDSIKYIAGVLILIVALLWVSRALSRRNGSNVS